MVSQISDLVWKGIMEVIVNGVLRGFRPQAKMFAKIFDLSLKYW